MIIDIRRGPRSGIEELGERPRYPSAVNPTAVSQEVPMFENWQWSDFTSSAAVGISIATFLWTRIDKWRDRRAAAAARKPLVNIVANAISSNRWHISVSVENRGDFNIRIDQIAVPRTFTMQTGHGEQPSSQREFNQHCVQGGKVGFSFELGNRISTGRKLRFAVTITELGPTDRKFTIYVRRKLPLLKD